MAAFDNGFRAVDISDPENPFLVGSYNTPGRALGVVVSGNYAYVADGSSPDDVSNRYSLTGSGSNGNFQVIDISDPTKPLAVGSCETPGTAYDVDVSGTYAYVADSKGGLQVIDVSDPENPLIAGQLNTPQASGVHITGNTAYMLDDIAGLILIDISDPLNPVISGWCNTRERASDVDVSGAFAYVTSGISYVTFDAGLQVIQLPQ